MEPYDPEANQAHEEDESPEETASAADSSPSPAHGKRDDAQPSKASPGPEADSELRPSRSLEDIRARAGKPRRPDAVSRAVRDLVKHERILREVHEAERRREQERLALEEQIEARQRLIERVRPSVVEREIAALKAADSAKRLAVSAAYSESVAESMYVYLARRRSELERIARDHSAAATDVRQQILATLQDVLPQRSSIWAVALQASASSFDVDLFRDVYSSVARRWREDGAVADSSRGWLALMPRDELKDEATMAVVAEETQAVVSSLTVEPPEAPTSSGDVRATLADAVARIYRAIRDRIPTLSTEARISILGLLVQALLTLESDKQFRKLMEHLERQEVVEERRAIEGVEHQKELMEAPSLKRYVVRSSAPVRHSADGKSKRIGTLPVGVVVRELDRQGAWRWVSADSNSSEPPQQGWVHIDHLRPMQRVGLSP